MPPGAGSSCNSSHHLTVWGGGGTRDTRSGGADTESAAMRCHANEQPHLSQSCPRCIVAQTARCGVTIHSTQTYRPRFCRFCVAFVGQWQVCSQCPRGAPDSLLERAPIHRSPLSGLVPHCGTILGASHLVYLVGHVRQKHLEPHPHPCKDARVIRNYQVTFAFA